MENSTGYGIEAQEAATQTVPDTEGALAPEDGGFRIGPEESTEEESAPATEDTEPSEDENDGNEPVDYEKIMREDLEVLRASFPELSELNDISELSGAMRYAALRDLGLSAIEAYLATSHRVVKRDSRAHLSTAISHTAGAPRGAMSRGELAVARELFSGLTDAQLYSLYKRVTK